MNEINPQRKVLLAARDQGVSSILFRNAIGRKLGLNVTDNECMSFLMIKGTATPSELGRYTGLTSGSTTAMLDRLEKAGFITRTPNPNDRRGTLVRAAKKWMGVTRPLVEGMQEAHNALLASYSDAELEIIADFLIRFTHNTQEQAVAIEKASS